MNRRMMLTATAAALIFAGGTDVQAKSAPPVIDGARISQDVKVISGDDYEGRGIATRAEPKVIDYISAAFKKAGLQPGGDNGGWTQEVHLRKFVVSHPQLSFALPDGKTMELHPGVELTVSTRGALSDVSFKDTPLVFVGYGVTAPERGWDDFKGPDGKDIDVKGKIIVVLINDPDFVQPELNTFNGKAMTYYGRWTYKFEEAARRGAAGCLIIHDTDAASYGWATVRNSNSDTKFDIVRADPSLVSPKLESWISHDTADALFKAAGLDLDALRVKARSKDFTPVALDGVTLNGGYGVTTSEIVTHNIIGKLPGRLHPDQTVLYSAHWDHLGICAPDAADKICNGAADNGTGVGALLELARAYGKAPKTGRTVAFIAFTAEESGLLGAEYYATHPVFPLARTVAGFNMDTLNVTGRAHNIEVTGAGQSTLEDDLVPAAAAQGRVVTPDETPEAGHFFRADHFPLVKRGVPMLYASSGLDKINGGEPAGRAAWDDYYAHRYHQPGDEWSPTWDWSGLVEDVTLYYRMGRTLANSTTWPQWKPSSEFKAARDATAAERK